MNPILDAYQQPFDYAPTVKLKQASGSGQRLPISLHPTQALSVNPLHPNCYTVLEIQ